jgi:hypothetical protein
VRGCLLTLVALVAVIAALIWLALPPLAGTLVQGALVAGGLEATTTVVTVTADPPPRLLSLNADTVEIHATNATIRGLSAAELDVTLHGVSIVDRTFERLDGTLRGVRLTEAAGTEAGIPVVVLSGTSEAVRATMTLTAADAEALGTSAVERTVGITPSSVRLAAPDRVRIAVGGQTVDGRLAVRADGSLVLLPPASLSLDPIVVLAADPTMGLRVLSFRVVDGGLILVATFDPGFG